MSGTYTWDVFSTVDGFASYGEGGDWGGYWGKEGPEFLARREAQLAPDQRMVLGATTFREFQHFLPAPVEDLDPINAGMKGMPTTVISRTITGPVDWPDATVVAGDAVEVVAHLKQTSPVPLHSHGSLVLNRALMAAGLVDRVQLTVFPVISGITGTDPVFAGAADFDLELLESTLLDGSIQELVYRPTLHG